MLWILYCEKSTRSDTMLQWKNIFEEYTSIYSRKGTFSASISTNNLWLIWCISLSKSRTWLLMRKIGRSLSCKNIMFSEEIIKNVNRIQWWQSQAEDESEVKKSFLCLNNLFEQLLLQPEWNEFSLTLVWYIEI